jgi:ribosomal protein S18 acetylase RimI-like enzyme
MSSSHSLSGVGAHAVAITRVAEWQWHALGDDHVVGRGEAFRRPDGRIFLSIDAWHAPVFDQLAATMLARLPRPLYTVVDEADLDLASHWTRAGFTTRRREWEYLVRTDPEVTGLGSVLLPPDVTILAIGEAEAGPLSTLDGVIRTEIDATIGWPQMPAEVLARPLDPSKYAVAVQAGQYVGLLRVALVTRQPRIGLIAVRVDTRRRGIARALLAQVLGSLHRLGIGAAWAEVDESNLPATALFAGIDARRTSSNLELVLHTSQQPSIGE